MSLSQFYRQQAAQQQSAADDATLDNVRERCQRAFGAWSMLADRSERAETARIQTALIKSPGAITSPDDIESPDVVTSSDRVDD